MGGFAQIVDGLAALWKWAGADPVPLAARLALAILFVAAGGYKVRHPLVAATAMVNFRVTRHARKPLGALLGWAEIAVAAGLASPAPMFARAGCVAAGLFAVAYVVVTARALNAGERFPCDCLPGLVGEVSAASVARAVAMLAGSIIGALAPAGVPSPRTVLSAAGLALAAIGVPLAISVAVTAWRGYRRLLADTDWELVFAVRGGNVAIAQRENGVDRE